MNKISLVYYSATGNTEQMAKAIEEGIVEAGGKVTVYKASEMNKDDILSSDVIAMGSPAMGAEVIDENYLSVSISSSFSLRSSFFAFRVFGKQNKNEYSDRQQDKQAIINQKIIPCFFGIFPCSHFFHRLCDRSFYSLHFHTI